MTLAADLKNLKPGDIVEMRNGRWRVVETINSRGITSGNHLSWFPNGKFYKNGMESIYDIVRVIKAKPDEDAEFLRIMAQLVDEPGKHSRCYADRLRKIAKLLEAMK